MDATGPLHVEVYETHEQLEASMNTVDDSPLNRDTHPDATLDLEPGTDFDESDEEAEEPKDCGTTRSTTSSTTTSSPVSCGMRAIPRHQTVHTSKRMDCPLPG